jgi:hypothetical protein
VWGLTLLGRLISRYVLSGLWLLWGRGRRRRRRELVVIVRRRIRRGCNIFVLLFFKTNKAGLGGLQLHKHILSEIQRSPYQRPGALSFHESYPAYTWEVARFKDHVAITAFQRTPPRCLSNRWMAVEEVESFMIETRNVYLRAKQISAIADSFYSDHGEIVPADTGGCLPAAVVVLLKYLKW